MGWNYFRFVVASILFAALGIPVSGQNTRRAALDDVVPVHVNVTLSPRPNASKLSPLFLGLSYEQKVVLPKEGRYYFDSHDANLIRLFHTLGITSLRVGANAVDDPKIAVPDTKDIDALFHFAHKAGVKVIYSFRLKHGDPADAARLAKYIHDHYARDLDCYSIGNEPNFYLKPYDAFRDEWRREEEAILKAVPDAKFDGPAAAGKEYALKFADDFFPGGHISMVSDHAYPLGNGRDAEKHPAAARAQFVSNRAERHYQRMYDEEVLPLAQKNIPFRMDETNSCYHGGARDCSDTYASTLWGLDYMNWWATHNIVGLNFHTGDTVNGYPDMVANYAAFVHNANGKTFAIHPLSYAMLAFTEVAHGKPMTIHTNAPAQLNFSAYAYDDGKKIYAVFMNKSFGDKGEPARVTIDLPADWSNAHCQIMTLQQTDSDIAAKTGVELGNAIIDPQGHWRGDWTKLNIHAANSDAPISIKVPPATAVLQCYSK